MKNLSELKAILQEEVGMLTLPQAPSHLYTPISYILSLNGKKIRPLLVMLSNEMFGGITQNAIHPAIAIEWFHNFTLMHDDIMDKAPMRRGKPTVHQKWNTNTAILSGDVMLVKAYEFLQTIDLEYFKPIFVLFNKTAIEVCEGQQMDMNFEQIEQISVDEYLEMIRLKTAVLLACALKLGAILARTSDKNADLMYQIGESLGLAFQIQDDYLDAYGNPDKFGKQIGGDILANKKTFLWLTALQDANELQRQELIRWTDSRFLQSQEKVEGVIAIYNALQIQYKAQHKMEYYTQKAFHSLDAIDIPYENKIELRMLMKSLLSREV